MKKNQRRIQNKAAPPKNRIEQSPQELSIKPLSYEKHVFVLLTGLLVITLAGWLGIAYLTSSPAHLLIADMIDGHKLFGVDDAYRFYIAKSSLSDLSFYAWNYVMPVPALLDGIISYCTGGNLFLARAAHIVLMFVSFIFIYKACISTGASRLISLGSILTLALMPIYGFIYLSFYGENWLNFFFSLLVYFCIRSNYVGISLLCIILPLTRPEGLFIAAPVFLSLLINRKFIHALVVAASGLLYLLFIFLYLDQPSVFMDWRLTFRSISNTFFSKGIYENRFFSTYNAFWIITCLAGLLLLARRKEHNSLHVSIGALILCSFVSTLIAFNLSYYEARYFYTVFPLMLVGFAFMLTRLYHVKAFSKSATGLHVIISIFITFIIFENLLQSDPIRDKFGYNSRWPISQIGNSIGQTDFRNSKDVYPYTVSAIQTLYDAINLHPTINKVVIFDTSLFYYLDPQKIPERIQVSLAPIDPGICLLMLKNQFYIMHPQNRQFEILRFSEFKSESQDSAIYVGGLPCPGCTPLATVGPHTMYRFHYISIDQKITWTERHGN